jgi:hypothetical protein
VECKVRRKWVWQGALLRSGVLNLAWLLTSIIQATQETDIRRIQFDASLGKKLVRSQLNTTSWVWCTLVIPVTQEA